MRHPIMQHTHKAQRFLGIGLVSIILLAAISFLWTPQAEAVLPPRPTVSAPARAGDAEHAGPTPVPVTGQIYLHVVPTTTSYWTVVQWKDDRGYWHDVSSWQGHLSGGDIMWWVEERDFGKGPFRWAIYARAGGPLVATSHEFSLPNQVSPTWVYVSIPQSPMRRGDKSHRKAGSMPKADKEYDFYMPPGSWD